MPDSWRSHKYAHLIFHSRKTSVKSKLRLHLINTNLKVNPILPTWLYYQIYLFWPNNSRHIYVINLQRSRLIFMALQVFFFIEINQFALHLNIRWHCCFSHSQKRSQCYCCDVIQLNMIITHAFINKHTNRV